MTGLVEVPASLDDVAEWLGVEVLPGQGDNPPTTRLRQLGSHAWSQRPGSYQELKLYRTVVALAKTMPAEGRDIVIDVARLREAFILPHDVPVTPDRVFKEVGLLRGVVERRTEERNTARAAAQSTNEDLIAAVSRLRAIRAQGDYRRDTMPFLRREGELNAFDMVLRLLRGEEIGRGGTGG